MFFISYHCTRKFVVHVKLLNRVLNGELKPNHLLLLSHENSTRDGDLLGVIALQSFKLGDVTGLT